MPGKHETSRKASSVLKTTTWGAVIALSAALLMAGLVGLNPGTPSGDLGRPSAQLAENGTQSAAHSTARTQANSSYSDAIPRDSSSKDSSSPAARREAQASLPRAANLGGSSKWYPATPSHSNTSSNDAASSVASANLSPSERQAAIAAKISPDLKGINPGAPVDVIVQYKTAAGVSDVAADGATAKAELPLVHAQLVTVQGSSLATLAAHDSVAYISPDRKVRGAMDPVVTAVNADIATAQGWNGAGVGVAIIDSGVGMPGRRDGTRISVTSTLRWVPRSTSTGRDWLRL